MQMYVLYLLIAFICVGGHDANGCRVYSFGKLQMEGGNMELLNWHIYIILQQSGMVQSMCCTACPVLVIRVCCSGFEHVAR